MKKLRIGTRGSKLALWQANHVADLLARQHPTLTIDIVPIKTEGDRRVDVPLSEIGGKGLFIKELENALLSNKIDLAVHSMKDVTVFLSSSFSIPVILKRENPFDAFVSNHYQSIGELPKHAVIGTCSLRRKSQLLNIRPDLHIKNLRGNVTTRLQRLDEGNFAAIILAVSGLRRLGLEHRISQVLSSESHVPSPGQGALGIECRSADKKTMDYIAPINHAPSNSAVSAERLVNRELGGSCYVPLGIHATTNDTSVNITAFIASSDGTKVIRDSVTGYLNDIAVLAQELAQKLRVQGADKILAAYQN